MATRPYMTAATMTFLCFESRRMIETPASPPCSNMGVKANLCQLQANPV